MKKHLLFWPCIGLLALTVLSGFIMERAFQAWFLDHTDEELSSVVSSVKTALNKTYHDNQIIRLDRITDDTNQLKPNVRITLLRKDGNVVGDSELTPSQITNLDNHLEREEIKEALSEGIGHAKRFSETIQDDLIYLAEYFHDDNFDGVIRVSTSTEHMTEALWGLRTIMAFIVLGMCILVALLIVASQKLLNQHIVSSQEALEANVAERTKEIELLHRLANMLAACNTMTEAQQVVEDIVPRLIGNLNGAIALIRSSRNQLEVKLDWGGKWPGESTYAPHECWALRKGKYHLANDEHTSLPCKHMSTLGNDQTLCIPLIAHGNTIGILHLYLADQELTQEKMQVAFTIGEHLGLALANLNLQDKLREQAIRDPLTGLYNRRYLEESLDHEILRAHRRKHCLSVLMLDVDHFKRFNDTFGHDAGDYVLKTLGTLLSESVRGEDIVCRVGGEELAIILPETGGESAGIVAAKLCEAVRQMHLELNGQSLGQLTVSIGIACYPNQGEKAESLLKAADLALYEAKDSGRDRFCYSQVQNENMMSNTKTLVEQIMEGSLKEQSSETEQTPETKETPDHAPRAKNF
jgi:diguanylate cyclase (GGDEF)-like protein